MRTKNPKKHSIQPEPEVRACYPSIDNCASATGIPVSEIKRAKRGGCAAFDSGSRVKLLPLLKWLFSQPNEDGEEMIVLEHQQARLAKEKADALKEKRLKEQKETDFLIEVEEILNEQVILPCRAWLTSAPSSLAGRCNPTSPEVARKILDEALNKEFFPLMRSKLTKSANKQK